MKRALLLLCAPLAFAGCSQSQSATNPQVAPTFSTSATIETASQVNDEIKKRNPGSSLLDSDKVVIDILDNAQSDRTPMAVKDWAKENNDMGNALAPSQNPRMEALYNSLKWLAAAADAKAAQLRNETPTTDYEADKKNALAEAARADSLPIN